MGEVYYIFGDKNIPRAQVAFSSLVRAMNGFVRTKEHRDNHGEEVSEAAPVMAVVRLVSSDNSPPKMGVALARSTDKIDYMVWVRVRMCDGVVALNGRTTSSKTPATTDALRRGSSSLCIPLSQRYQRQAWETENFA